MIMRRRPPQLRRVPEARGAGGVVQADRDPSARDEKTPRPVAIRAKEPLLRGQQGARACQARAG